MFISQISIRQDNAPIGRIARVSTSDGYRIHQYIWHLFSRSPYDKRSFLYRLDEQRSIPAFIAVADRKPIDPDGIWNIDTKPYNPKLRRGMRLAFTLRVNPVRTKRKGPEKRHTRHDVVMEAKRLLRKEGLPRKAWPPQGAIVHQAGMEWMEAKADKCGFEIEKSLLRADGYRQHCLYKRGGAPIRFSTMDISGILEVKDTELFVHLLYNGIGPAKGFGCGLLLVQRV